MDADVRNFIEVYKYKPMPVITVADFIKDHNHEIWRNCPNCGNQEDLRDTFICSECGTTIFEPKSGNYSKTQSNNNLKNK